MADKGDWEGFVSLVEAECVVLRIFTLTSICYLWQFPNLKNLIWEYFVFHIFVLGALNLYYLDSFLYTYVFWLLLLELIG